MNGRVPTVERTAHRSLTDIAYESVSQAIFDREFPPGGRLGIDAVAQQLAMSITPVREALARLASEGLITQAANKGFAVAPLLSPTEFHSLFTARRVLEMEALRARPDGTGASARVLDPQYAPDSMIAGLGALADAMRHADRGPTYASYGRFTRLDGEFHKTLVDLSGNRFLGTAWRSLHFHLHVSRLYAGAGIIDFEQACTEHDLILTAVRHRDGPGLGTQATEHILCAEERLAKLLENPKEVADGEDRSR